MINRAEIKQEAKSIMRGARVSPVLMGTLVLAISLILDRIISLVEYGTFFPDFRIFQSLSYLASVDPMLLLEMDTNDMLALAGLASSATVYSLFFSILVSLFMTVLYGGFYLYCMGIRQGREMPVSTLMDGLSLAGKLIWCSILTGIKVFLWSLLFVFPGSSPPTAIALPPITCWLIPLSPQARPFALAASRPGA